MRHLLLRGFAVLAWLGFLAAIGYFLALVIGLLPPRPAEPAASALVTDAGLVLLFGGTHSLMARPWFKRRWTRLVAPAAERSVYVAVADVALVVLTWQWRPIVGPPVWVAPAPYDRVLFGLQLAGIGFALIATFLIDYFELYGLRQAFERPIDTSFRTPLFYRLIRHPQYLGLLVAFWSAPQMGRGRLALALGLSAYILIGAVLEERVLLATLGEPYRRYRKRVPMLLPVPWRRRGS